MQVSCRTYSKCCGSLNLAELIDQNEVVDILKAVDEKYKIYCSCHDFLPIFIACCCHLYFCNDISLTRNPTFITVKDEQRMA
jgi:hypothetical protein